MRRQGRSEERLVVRLLVALGVVLVLTSCTITGVTTQSGTPTPSSGTGQFAQAPCPFSMGSGFIDGQNVICGYLSVPEDRHNPKSRKIQLAVATFKTPSANPAPDPVIFLQGGPGGRIVKDIAGAITSGFLDLQTQFGNHDLILVDQRGTGYSTPSLQCPEVVRLQYQTDVNVTPQQSVTIQNQALAQCRSRLVGEGINLSAYTTYTDANDIHDLIGALGYSQVDIYGVSYGTRLALEIMRSFPQHIRSVILDSTVPPQLRLLTSVPSSTARVFNTLFQGCASDPGCNAQYPNLASVFYSLITTLNAHPVTFQTTDQSTGTGSHTVLFHGDDLVNLAFTSFYVAQAIPLVPQLIYQVRNGDYSDASRLYGALIFDDSVSWGMYYSVECAEDVDFLNSATVAAAAQAYPPALRPDQLIGLEGELPACANWGVRKVATSESQPVTSAIPTLVMESEYDPITPPANGDLVAQTLSHSYKFLFPGVGHGAMLSNLGSQNPSAVCPTLVAIAFWNTPTQKPDGSCIPGMGEPQFQ
jgi:pimeloyl-ACP methyl ester carboxylesterase